MRLLTVSALAAVIVPAIGLISCQSKGPQPPKPGSPAFYWRVAQDAYQKGNFSGAVEQLSRITTSDNEYRNRARVLLMTLSAGMARGEMEFADAYDEGAKAARDRQLDFKKQASAARAAANQNAMRFVELTHDWTGAVKDADVALGFPMPAIEANKPVELARAAKGVALQPAEMEKARTVMQQRGVVLALARVAGAGTDLQKATGLLAAGDAKIPREAFLLSTARELTDLTDLYAPKKLDESGKVRLLCREAKEALALIPTSKAAADLHKRIDKTLAKLPKATT